MATISACMIVKNEEDCLERCLISIRPLVDEIVLVDTGSTDKTKEIAEKYGCKIFDHPWENSFSIARNQAFSHATSDWCLIVDADEEIPKSEHVRIKNIIADNVGNLGDADCYFFRVRNIMESSGNYSVMPSIRLVRNHIGAYYTSVVHNQMVNYGKHDNLTVVVLHYGYDGIAKEKKEKKIVRTFDLLQESIKNEPENIFNVFNLARHYNFMQDWSNGREWCLKCIQRLNANPKVLTNTTTYSSIYFSLFIACFNQKDYWTPQGHLEYINGLLPDYIDGHFALATCYSFQMDVRRAENEFLANYFKLLERYNNGELHTHAELWSPSMEPYAYFYLGLMFHKLASRNFAGHWLDKAKRIGHKTVNRMMVEGGLLNATV